MSVRAHVSRRSAVTSAALAPLLLSACDIDPPVRETAAGDPVHQPPEDSELVKSVAAAIVVAAGMVTAVSESIPALSTRLASLSQAHAAHLEILIGALPDAAAPTADAVAVAPRPARALAAVRRSEQRLLRSLRESCLAASSGDLSRVLASMAGSVSQHSAALTKEPAG